MLLDTMAAADPASGAAKSIGAVFWLIISVIGIIKCFSISKRESTSTLCVHGLTLWLFAYALGQILFVLKGVWGPGSIQAVAGLLVGIVICILSITGVVLAIIGLVSYSCSFSKDGVRREYVQGRKQAIWGICLNTLYILIFIGAFVSGIIKRQSVGSLQRLAQQAAGQKEFVFEEENFRITMPEGNWVKLDAQRMNPESCLMLMTGRPPVYLSVIAEQYGVNLDFSLDQLVSFVQSNLKGNLFSAVLTDPVIEEYNGLVGKRFQVRGRMANTDIVYDFWCTVKNGYCYQVLLWSGVDEEERMVRMADRVFAAFRQNDPDQRCYSGGVEPFGVRGSIAYGYEVNLEDTDWLSWEQIGDVDPLTDCGGVHPQGMRFSVVPMLMPTNAPLTILKDSFLRHYGSVDPIPTNCIKEVEMQGLSGLEYTYANTENRCKERIVLSEGCAWLISVWQPLSDGDELATGLVEQVFSAVCLMPGDVAGADLAGVSDERRGVQAELWNSVGLGYYAESQYENALPWFTSGYYADPTNAVYFGNVLAAYTGAGRFVEGLEAVAAVPEHIRNSDHVKSWEAELLAEDGQVEAAAALYRELFESGYESEQDLKEWTQLLADNGLWDGMDEIFSAFSGADPSEELLLHQLRLYYDKGDFETVVDRARGFLDDEFRPVFVYWVIDSYQELGLFSEALEACEELLGKGYRTVDALQEKAYCEYRLNWYRKAKTTLEEALTLNPKNETTVEWLGLVSAKLGEGDNSCLKEAISPVELPAVFEAELAVAAPEGFGQDFGAYYEQFQTLWSYRKGKALKRTDSRMVKVLDEAGVSAFSSFEFSFNPISQSIFVNKLIIRDGSGKVVAQGAVRDYFVLDDDSDELVDEDKKLVIPVPGLCPGYSIELMVTRSYGSSPEEFYYEQHYLASGFPVLNCAVFLSGDVDSVKRYAFNRAVEIRQDEGILWKRAEPYAYQWEVMQVPVERFLPGVVLGSGDACWADSARAHYDTIKDRLVADESVRNKADELTKGLKSHEDKYKAIVDWVRSSFIYKPLEFGRSGYIPDYPKDTFAYHYGDCKDLSVLLKVMLEHVGIICDLVLIHTGTDLVAAIPNVDQFNHMITYLPEIRGGLFVDPTDQEADAFVEVPQQLAQRTALVFGEKSGRLVELPDYRPDSSSCRITRTVRLGDDDGVKVSDVVEIQGYYASWMRAALKEGQKVNRVQWFQEHVAGFVPGLEVTDVAVEDLMDNAKPLTMRVTYIQHHGLSDDGEGKRLSVPSVWTAFYLSFRNVPNRKNPFRISYPLQFDLECAIESDLYQKAAGSFLEASGNHACFKWSLGTDGTFSCSVIPGTYAADQYQGFIAEVNKSLNAARWDVKLQKTNPVALK